MASAMDQPGIWTAFVFLAFSALALGQACAAAEERALAEPTSGTNEANIIDLNRQWHFASIDGLYDVNGRKLICAETAQGDFVFWDPQGNSIVGATSAGPNSKSCAGPNATLLKTLVPSPPVRLQGLNSGPSAGDVHWDTSYGGGATIWQELDPESASGGNCGMSSPFYFEVVYPSGTVDSFYVVARLKKPTEAHSQSLCGEAEGTVAHIPSERYRTIFSLESTDIGNGRTVLDGGGVDTAVVFLQINSLPKSLWSSNGDVFVVPYKTLAPKLHAAGTDESARYHALLEAIGRADE